MASRPKLKSYNVQTLYVGSCEKGFTNCSFEEVPFDMFRGRYGTRSNFSITMIDAESADDGRGLMFPTADI